MIHLVLPVPPSANRYWRRAGVRLHRSVEAVNYIGIVTRMCRIKKLPTLHGPIALDIEWYRGRRAGDLDNKIKCLQDSLAHAGVFENDSQVVRITAERFEDKQKPRIEVTITAYERAA